MKHVYSRGTFIPMLSIKLLYWLIRLVSTNWYVTNLKLVGVVTPDSIVYNC